MTALEYLTTSSQAHAKSSGGRIGGRPGFYNHRKNTSNSSVDIPRKMYSPQTVQEPPSVHFQTYVPSTPIFYGMSHPPIINWFPLLESVIFFYVLILLLLRLLKPKKR